MEKERIAHEVFNTLCPRTQPHRDTVAAHQIPLVTFFCVSMYGGTARGIGTYLERFWVKIPDYFCLSTYKPATGTPDCSQLTHAACAGATLWAYWRDTGALPA